MKIKKILVINQLKYYLILVIFHLYYKYIQLCNDINVQNGIINIVRIIKIVLMNCQVNFNAIWIKNDVIQSIINILLFCYGDGKIMDTFRSNLYRFLISSIDIKNLQKLYITQILKQIIDLLDVEISYTEIIYPPETQLLMMKLFYKCLDLCSINDKYNILEKHDLNEIKVKLSGITRILNIIIYR